MHKKSDKYELSFECVFTDENNPPPPEFTVRLIGGRSQYEGRVEMFYSGRWGTVCIDEDWDINDARVICRQLNFTGADVAYQYARFGSAIRSPTWLGNLQCSGSEESVINCIHNDFRLNNCNPYRDASIKCTGM